MIKVNYLRRRRVAEKYLEQEQQTAAVTATTSEAQVAGCTGKQGYETRSDAARSLEHVRHAKRLGSTTKVRIYQCATCNKHHIGGYMPAVMHKTPRRTRQELLEAAMAEVEEIRQDSLVTSDTVETT
jgi:hypothetical protein